MQFSVLVEHCDGRVRRLLRLDEIFAPVHEGDRLLRFARGRRSPKAIRSQSRIKNGLQIRFGLFPRPVSGVQCSAAIIKLS